MAVTFARDSSSKEKKEGDLEAIETVQAMRCTCGGEGLRDASDEFNQRRRGRL